MNPSLHLKHLGSHGASLVPRAAHHGQPIESKHRQAGKWFTIRQLLQRGASCRAEVLNLPPSAGLQAAVDGVAGVGDQSGISQQFTIRALQGGKWRSKQPPDSESLGNEDIFKSQFQRRGQSG